MNLIIDVGNTRTKVALMDDDLIVDKHVLDRLTIDILESIKSTNTIEAVIISNVNSATAISFVEYIKSWKILFIQLSHETPLPIVNTYKTPETLGKDRLAAVVAANHLFPNSNCLIIDAGTCITYDFINENNYYLGGSISPGLEMRYKAMHQFTASLPLLNKQRLNTFVGYNTETAMHTGVEAGLAFEIQGFINKYIHKFGQIKVIMAGGDAEYLASMLKNSIFVSPDLVLIGLYKILTYNANLQK
jgi:type III pantothenate kinase